MSAPPEDEFEGRKLAGVKMRDAYQNALQTASKIETFNMQFFGALLKQDVLEPDPQGYECIQKTEEFSEIEYDEEIFCFLKTVPTCSKTKVVKYNKVQQEKCQPRYKYNCYIEMKDVSMTMNSRLCNKTPIRDCDAEEGKIVCQTVYESVCETVYHQKNVTEVQPTCKTITMPMCMKNENGVENCVQIPRKQCEVKEVIRLRAVPQTGCKQVQREVCGNEMCPLTIKETCQDKPKTIVNQVGEETCELEKHQFCQPVWQLIPHFEDEEFCTDAKREVCEARKVNPREVIKHKPIKLCTRISK